VGAICDRSRAPTKLRLGCRHSFGGRTIARDQLLFASHLDARPTSSLCKNSRTGRLNTIDFLTSLESAWIAQMDERTRRAPRPRHPKGARHRALVWDGPARQTGARTCWPSRQRRAGGVVAVTSAGSVRRPGNAQPRADLTADTGGSHNWKPTVLEGWGSASMPHASASPRSSAGSWWSRAGLWSDPLA
jgi:hypothetical protein